MGKQRTDITNSSIKARNTNTNCLFSIKKEKEERRKSGDDTNKQQSIQQQTKEEQVSFSFFSSFLPSFSPPPLLLSSVGLFCAIPLTAFTIPSATTTSIATRKIETRTIANAAIKAEAIKTDYTIPVDVTAFNKFLESVASIKSNLGIEKVRTPEIRKSIRTLDLISLRTAIDNSLDKGRGGSASDWIERRKVVDKVFRSVTADVISLEELTTKISKRELEVDFPATKRLKVMDPLMKKLETDIQKLVASLAEEDANMALGSARARFTICSNGYLICDNYK